MRVIDVETGKVLTSVQAEGTARSVGANVTGDIKGADFKSEAFSNTPLGEATRAAIKEALQKIAEKVPTDRTDREVPVAKSKPAAANRAPAQSGNRGVSATTTTSDTYCNLETNRSFSIVKNHVSPDQSDRWTACKVTETSATGTSAP